MRYSYHQSTVVKTLVVCALLVAISSLCYGVDYTVHVVEPAVNNYMILRDGPLPPVCKEATAIELSACRGEYEPASFVVTASKPLESVRIEVGQLTGVAGSWPEDAVDVRVVKEYYRGALGGSGAPVPTLLVHDESFLAIEPAPTETNPKAMKNVLRGELRDTAELQPVEINTRKQFWVTVHVPEHAKPGTYSTTVQIVPQNDDTSVLSLQVQVHPFTLLPPMLEYSMYYPVRLVPEGSQDWRSGEWRNTAWITPQQYIAECKNMLAHGLSNPNIYAGPTIRPDGSLDFSVLEEILDLRESVGMRPKALYQMGNACPFVTRPLTPEERQQTHRYVPEINAWARERGYEEVFHMAIDEMWGEGLSAERDSMAAVDEAGGLVFVAIEAAQLDRVWDVLHRPVLATHINAHMSLAAKKYGPEEWFRHTAEIAKAADCGVVAQQELYRRAIDTVHRFGYKIYTYMNPPAGVPLPELQRRSEGLGLWKVGFDGTMTWAYMHIKGDPVGQAIGYAKVYRTENGVLDTLHWEGWREGVDDVRYLTTLLDALNRARGRFPDEPLISETDEWVDGIDVANGDLDAIRREMARRIVALMDLGYKDLSPEEALADVDVERVQIVAFPEPWRFKMDSEDQGVSEGWFQPNIDDSEWSTLRTDTKEEGWGTDPGFGWYRTELPLAEQDATRKFKYLYFGACDEDAWIYLDGRQIFDHSCEATGLLPSEIWVVPFVVPLTDAEVRSSDLLAVRVYNSGGLGGIWKPVRLILSDQELTKQQVNALIELKTGQ